MFLEDEIMTIRDQRRRALLCAVVCAGVFSMSEGALASTPYPLFCQGPFDLTGVPPKQVPLNWSLKGAGAAPPAAGHCAWADRGPRGSEIQTGGSRNPATVFCPFTGFIAFAFLVTAGQYSEFCVFRDPSQHNCMQLYTGANGQAASSVNPPFSGKPVCPW
jgi:hypothetical protein